MKNFYRMDQMKKAIGNKPQADRLKEPQ